MLGQRGQLDSLRCSIVRFDSKTAQWVFLACLQSLPAVLMQDGHMRQRHVEIRQASSVSQSVLSSIQKLYVATLVTQAHWNIPLDQRPSALARTCIRHAHMHNGLSKIFDL